MPAYVILLLYHFFTKNVNSFLTLARDTWVGPKAKALGLLENALHNTIPIKNRISEIDAVMSLYEFLFYNFAQYAIILHVITWCCGLV